MRGARIGGLCLALVAALACATPAPPAVDALAQRELAFLVDGATTREQAALRLGLPNRAFEADRILIYRLAWEAERGLYTVAWHQFPLRAYDLVLVFDARGVLAEHALVAK